MSVIRVQGWYYLLGGLWPLVHYRSFESVVGPKPARFQTEVTAVLFVAVGAALLVGDRPAPGPATRLLSAASAAGLLLMDWRYRHRLPAVLKADGVLQGVFLAGAVRHGLAQRAASTR